MYLESYIRVSVFGATGVSVFGATGVSVFGATGVNVFGATGVSVFGATGVTMSFSPGDLASSWTGGSSRDGTESGKVESWQILGTETGGIQANATGTRGMAFN